MRFKMPVTNVIVEEGNPTEITVDCLISDFLDIIKNNKEAVKAIENSNRYLELYHEIESLEDKIRDLGGQV